MSQSIIKKSFAEAFQKAKASTKNQIDIREQSQKTKYLKYKQQNQENFSNNMENINIPNFDLNITEIKSSFKSKLAFIKDCKLNKPTGILCC